MGIITRLISVITAIIMTTMHFFGLNTGSNEPFRVTTYVVASTIQNETNLHSEDFDIITDAILFGCVTFDAKGDVNADKETLETALGNLRNTIGDRNVKIHLNVLGPGAVETHDTWEDTMNDQAKQHKLAFESGKLEKNLNDIINEYDFDGLYFDYEYPLLLKDNMDYSKFLVRMKETLGDKILGIAISKGLYNLTFEAIANVDRFELMIYDNYDENGIHSPYELSTDTVWSFVMNRIDKKKMDFGLPFYSRPTDHDAYWYGYNGYADKLDENGMYHDEKINKDFYFNTPDIIGAKTAFAVKNNLGGVMIWHYACDLPSTDSRSLLKAIGNNIK